MRRLPVLILVLVGAAAGLALGQVAGHPILHEDLPAPGGARAVATIGGSGDGATPAAITAGDKVLPEPRLDATDPLGQPVLGSGGFAADRDTSMRPDENTQSDSTLHYVSVFNPAVLPFKRMSAMDQIGDDFTLHVESRDLAALAVGGTTDPRTRDRFWGDVEVALRPGSWVPLPSVAPDMRILSFDAKPPVHLAFAKDGADNFFVKTDDAGASGTYHVVFLADADAGYFAPSLPPRRYTVAEVALRAPAALRPAIPPAVMQQARITLDKLGVDAGMDLGIAFNKLVEYFRGFQPGDITHPSGNVYRDLCDTKLGVCRHRSYAFMITSNALGIPARYVENEAHAFVEVWFPERGWQRIDLGGAALRMDVTGANNKTLHRPRAEDPFAKPPEYKQSYTQLEGEIHGLTRQQIADKRKGLDQAPASGAVSGGGGGAGGGRGQTDRIAPDPTLPPVAADPKKVDVSLAVTSADAIATRGATLHVEGYARSGGHGLADHRVTVYLAPAGQDGRGYISLGTATTGPDGVFKADLAVPDVELATYEIVVTSDEDATYNAAKSD